MDIVFQESDLKSRELVRQIRRPSRAAHCVSLSVEASYLSKNENPNSPLKSSIQKLNRVRIQLELRTIKNTSETHFHSSFCCPLLRHTDSAGVSDPKLHTRIKTPPTNLITDYLGSNCPSKLRDDWVFSQHPTVKVHSVSQVQKSKKPLSLIRTTLRSDQTLNRGMQRARAWRHRATRAITFMKSI